METFDEFYRRTFRKLFFYVMRMIGDSETAADIVQESFTRGLQRYGEANRDSAVLFAVARNLIRDGIRRGKRHESFLHSTLSEGTNGQNMIDIRDEYRQVMDGLQRLDEDSRDILALVASSGLSYREIAAMIGTTEANVKVKVHRARVRLKNILQNESP